MPVLWITVILSVLLALVFVVLFVKEHGRFHFGSPERVALLPLEDDGPPVPAARPVSAPVDSRASPRISPQPAQRPADPP